MEDPTNNCVFKKPEPIEQKKIIWGVFVEYVLQQETVRHDPCLHKNTVAFSLSTRSGDEMETEYIVCKDCNTNIKF